MSVFISVLSQFLILYQVGLNKTTDAFFLASAITKTIFVLYVSAMQNKWLQVLSISIEKHKTKFFEDISISIIQIVFVFILIGIFMQMYFLFNNQISKYYFYIFLLCFFVGTIANIIFNNLSLIVISRSQNILVEKLEVFGSIFQLTVVVCILYLELFYLIAFPYMLRYILLCLIQSSRQNYTFRNFLEYFTFEKLFQMNIFVRSGYITKLLPLLDKFIFAFMPSGFLSLFSFIQSIIASLQRTYWRSFGLTYISKQSKLLISKSLTAISYVTKAMVIGVTLLLIFIPITLIFDEFLISIFIKIFNDKEDLSIYLSLILICLLPLLLLSMPQGLSQSGLYAIGKSKITVSFAVIFEIFSAGIKILIFYFFGINEYLIAIFLLKIFISSFFYFYFFIEYKKFKSQNN